MPTNITANCVIVAHSLLESDLMEGGPVGKPVADYVFHLDGGEAVRVPLRERFEIAIVPPTYGGMPFVATPDQKNSLHPRDEGPWDLAGTRQMEAIQGMPSGYFLWVWRNPQPERALASIEIIPQDVKLIIAAITIGHLDEHPFVRTGRAETKIVVPQAEDAEKPFNLDVEVDRGVATYVHALPEKTADAFLNDDFKGWGESQNPKSSTAYVEIAATPSATVIVKQGGEALGKVK